MRAFPIRLRLTVWYFAVLAVTFAVFALLAFTEMRHSLLFAIENELRDRAFGFSRMMNVNAVSSREQIQHSLMQHAQGELIRIADLHGNWLFRSPVILRYESILPDIRRPGFVTVRADKPLRVFTTEVLVGGEPYRVQLAGSIAGYEEAMDRFGMMMLISLPVLLVIASAGGYWISRRALQPVDRITSAAVAITAQNLSSRLEVPAATDELHRLSETLNAMLERLESAFKRNTQFTADASHELRTPLALMRTVAEVSLRRPRSESEYRETLSTIVTELQTTTALLDRLLFLARADAGVELEKARTDLAEVIQEVANEGKIMADAKQIRLSTQIENGPLWIYGDRNSLKRLFLILIDNAIKYTPPEKSIQIQLATADHKIRFTIEDTGIGIGDSDLPHIFERFYRSEKARTPDSGGAGLGLAIASYIAEAHSGKIEVASKPGMGSVFSVLLERG